MEFDLHNLTECTLNERVSVRLKVAPHFGCTECSCGDRERKKKCGPIGQTTNLKILFKKQISEILFSKTARSHHRFIVPTAQERKSGDINQDHAAGAKHSMHLANRTFNITDPLMIKNAGANY